MVQQQSQNEAPAAIDPLILAHPIENVPPLEEAKQQIAANPIAEEIREASDQSDNNIINIQGNNENVVQQPIIRQRPAWLRSNPQQRDLGPFISNLVNDQEEETPLSYEEAIKLPAAEKWKEAAIKEFKTLQDNNTWELVDRPKYRKVLGIKWVFKIKPGNSTSDKIYKGRIVAKGYGQIPGEDYDPNEISSTVIKIKSLRIILALTVQGRKMLRSMDAISAFTQTPIKEEIYVEQPEGFAIDPQHKVLRLKMSLYGLKQASENWHKDISSFMISQGFSQSKIDENIFFKYSKTNRLIFVCLYVDDTTSAYSTEDEEEFEQFATALKDRFKITDLGETKSCLGMRIDYDREKGIMKLSQSKYINKILKTFNMSNCDPCSTPDSKNVDNQGPLSALHCPRNNQEKEFMKDKPYRQLIGSLIYLTTCTRPDLTHSVSCLARFASNPGPQHWYGAMRVLKYLKGTSHYSLNYYRKPREEGKFQITGSSDANWGNDIKGRRSLHGYIISFHGCPILWTSKKQTFVALSSTESEYVGLSESLREIKWLMSMLNEFNIPLQIPILYGDNTASIHIANNKTMENRIKGIDIKYHFIKDEIAKENVILFPVSSKENAADIFTKPLDAKRFSILTNKVLNNNTHPVDHTD